MFGIHVDRDFQDALLLAAAHGQEAVRRDAAQGRLGVEIVGVFRPFRLFAFDEFRMDDAFAGERAAQRVAGALVFRDTFGDDVARPARLSGVGTSAETNRRACCTTLRDCCARMISASGSRPRSRATVARVRRLGL